MPSTAALRQAGAREFGERESDHVDRPPGTGPPHTFIVLAALIFILGPLAVLKMPTDILPAIDIPVVSVVYSYNGLSAQEMANRITGNYERALTTSVEDIEHIESQTLNGVAVVKVFFHPGANITRAIAEASTSAESLLRILPAGTQPPTVLSCSASTVPILQLALSLSSDAQTSPHRSAASPR
jgi:multidrug efflux pump subunit AcrB